MWVSLCDFVQCGRRVCGLQCTSIVVGGNSESSMNRDASEECATRDPPLSANQSVGLLADWTYCNNLLLPTAALSFASR